MSTYDMLIAEGEKIGEIRGELKGKKEEQKKRTLEIILSIRSALRKRLAINTIALILNVSTDYVKKTQVELQKEVDVLELLKSQHTIKQIAQQLKISALVVEAIKNLKTKKQ